jgi:hypothetical protein
MVHELPSALKEAGNSIHGAQRARNHEAARLQFMTHSVKSSKS